MLNPVATRGNPWRERIVGLDQRVPLLDGRLARYINLDNAASTPPLRDVLDAVQRFLPYYSSVHRGTRLQVPRQHRRLRRGARTPLRVSSAPIPRTNTVIFGKNTTEAINKLAFRYPLARSQVVLSTVMEHHSNDLPWRRRAQVVRGAVTR